MKEWLNAGGRLISIRGRPERTGPIRRAGGFYRVDSKSPSGTPFLGEEAIVGTLRTAYRIAETQVNRGARFAKRIRSAGDKLTGGDSGLQALDATERLVFQALMAALGTLEAFSADRESPLKRLGRSQYRLLGSLLGFDTPDPGGKNDTAAPSEPAVEPVPEEVPAPPARSLSAGAARGLQVEHAEKSDRRAVRVLSYHIDRQARAVSYPLVFYSQNKVDADPIMGQLLRTDEGPLLKVTTYKLAPVGPWTAAICDNKGKQVGLVAIAL